MQIGTLAAVLSYFWRDIVRILAAMLADLRRGKLATTHDAQTGLDDRDGHDSDRRDCGLLFRHQIKTTLRSLYVMSAALGRRRRAAGDRRVVCATARGGWCNTGAI